ncbi:hypothetical protein N665_0064s0065 [Sinapis alba]|nr:hypothetical protein N665_0064s0065 [Sinapis alba]
MAQNQPIFQTKPQEHFVQIPINIERDSTTLINQTGNSNRKPNHWPTIILSTIFVIVGQSIAKLLENFYYDQINRSEYDESRQNDGVWTQALLQTVGFPLLLLPFIILLTTKKHDNQPCDQFHYKSLTIIYICIGIVMSVQARLYAMGKLEIPFGVFTLIYTTQLLFTLIFARFINKIKFNRWVVISLALAIATGALTLSSAFGGEPDEAEENYARGSWAALFAGVCFSLLLCNIQNVFDNYIFKRTESTTRKPSFASVFEVIIFSSLVATIISMVGLLIAGEQDDLKREMNEFSKGKGAYVMVMVGQAVSWQVYWVGIVGLVFSVSSVLSNVISVVTWPIVSVLVVIFFNFMDDEFDVFKGVALITAVLSAAAYFFRLGKENRNNNVIAN